MITYLKHHQIDKNRWDRTISESQNGLVYALSWYLDIVSPGWEALIEGDYEYVMPLPVKKILGFTYLVQPIFTQQLGIFSSNSIDDTKTFEFIKAVPIHFLRCRINLNSKNPKLNKNFFYSGINHELDLNREYSEIYQGFNENTKRNIRKSENRSLSVQGDNIELFINCYKALASPIPKNEVLLKLKSIIYSSFDKKMAEIYLVEKEGNSMAGAFFIIGNNRIIYLASFSSDAGKEDGAMFLIFNELIKKYASKNYIFDFEGSKIPGIARFFKGFGAKDINFPIIRKNLVLFGLN